MVEDLASFAALNRPLLLDGGMGRELRFRGVHVSEHIWSASALISDPEVVRQIHTDYIAAGADIITTNSYGIIRPDLAKDGIEAQFAALNRLAGGLAVQARNAADRPVLIAGSLPPLYGSYRPDLVRSDSEIIPLYEEQAGLLAPYVDLFLCETMSLAAEGRAAATAACNTGKPVWVSWTLHEDRSGRLRSGETIEEAVAFLGHLPITGYLANCCAPESITAAMPALGEGGAPWFGGYANTFAPVPPHWTLDGLRESDGLISLRDDLDPLEYVAHAEQWLLAGATVIGGCCGTRPTHIAAMQTMLATAPKD